MPFLPVHTTHKREKPTNVVFLHGDGRGCNSKLDVETVFLFPWAVVVQDLGVYGLFSILFFLVILVLGLAYAWKKGALEWK